MPVPVPNFEPPREDWHEDAERKGHHEGDYGHVDADLRYPKLELLPEKPNTFTQTDPHSGPLFTAQGVPDILLDMPKQ